MRIFKLILTVLLLTTIFSVYVKTESREDIIKSINSSSSRFGINYLIKGNIIEVVVDKNSAWADIITHDPINIFNRHVLSSQFSLSEIKMNQGTLLGTIGWYHVLRVIINLYAATNTDQLYFKVYLQDGVRKNLMFSFNFSFDQYKKINKEYFEYEQMGKLVTHISTFQFSKWYLDQIKNELLGSEVIMDVQGSTPLKHLNHYVYDSGPDLLKFSGENFYNPLGVYFSLEGNSLEIIVDQAKALKEISFYKKNRLINSNLTPSQIKIRKNGLTGIIGWVHAAMLLSEIYYSTDIDHLHVRCYQSSLDKDGEAEEHLLFTLNFTRDLYNMMGWQGSSLLKVGSSHKKLAKIPSDFRFSRWYLNQIFEMELSKDS